jgi:hypothetical protein
MLELFLVFIRIDSLDLFLIVVINLLLNSIKMLF